MDKENNKPILEKLKNIRHLTLNIYTNAIIIIKSILAEKYYNIMEEKGVDSITLNVKKVEENLYGPPDESHILKDDETIPNTFLYYIPMLIHDSDGKLVLTKEDVISDIEKLELLNSIFRMSFHIMNDILISNEDFFSNNIPEYNISPYLILGEDDLQAIMTDEEEFNKTMNAIFEDAQKIIKNERKSDEFKRKKQEEYERTIKAAKYKYSKTNNKE